MSVYERHEPACKNFMPDCLIGQSGKLATCYRKIQRGQMQLYNDNLYVGVKQTTKYLKE